MIIAHFLKNVRFSDIYKWLIHLDHESHMQKHLKAYRILALLYTLKYAFPLLKSIKKTGTI